MLCSPAPGFRDAGFNSQFGALLNVGYTGCNWSSSFSGTDGVFLNFYISYLQPGHISGRAIGFPLRCLSE